MFKQRRFLEKKICWCHWWLNPIVLLWWKCLWCNTDFLCFVDKCFHCWRPQKIWNFPHIENIFAVAAIKMEERPWKKVSQGMQAWCFCGGITNHMIYTFALHFLRSFKDMQLGFPFICLLFFKGFHPRRVIRLEYHRKRWRLLILFSSWQL